MLREVARVLADDAMKRVIVVDTSNEIAGDGDIPFCVFGWVCCFGCFGFSFCVGLCFFLG